MGLGWVHWGHQMHSRNAEKCPPSQIGSATQSAVANPRCNPGNAVQFILQLSNNGERQTSGAFK